MISVAVLGATGSVGQSFVRLLQNHPWFSIKEVVASERSAGKVYGSLVPNTSIDELVVKGIHEPLESSIVFSGLDASVAGDVESRLAADGHLVISNSRNHRYDPDVPLLIPEVNPDQMELLSKQTASSGKIVTNPNCSAIGLAMALRPLQIAFGIEQVHVVTMQAISGAGLNARKSLNIEDNVIPFIDGEEEKLERELQKIMNLNRISAQCNRVPVSDGHTQCVSVKLHENVNQEDLIEAWNCFRALPQKLDLPSAPKQPIQYFTEDAFPQTKLHRDLEDGMAISVGRVRECSLFDYKFVTLSHNTVRGAAGCAILNAELLVKTYYKNRYIVGAASAIG